MTERNSQLEPPPLLVQMITEDKKITPSWERWFIRLRYYLSNENHQAVEDSNSTASLDAEYIQLKANTQNSTISLAAPTLSGKIKILHMTERTNPYYYTMALTNVIGGSAATTATWDAVNEVLVLISLQGVWLVIKEYGVTLS